MNEVHNHPNGECYDPSDAKPAHLPGLNVAQRDADRPAGGAAVTPGFYWAKWKIADDGTVEGDELTPSNKWEPVEVVENTSDKTHPEYLKVSVPGVEKSQSPENFFWGPRILSPDTRPSPTLKHVRDELTAALGRGIIERASVQLDIGASGEIMGKTRIKVSDLLEISGLTQAPPPEGPEEFLVGDKTMAMVFHAAGLTNLSDMQAVLNAVELALTPIEIPDFQTRVNAWMLVCFGAVVSADGIERNYRFLEEALELVQALGCTAKDAHRLVDYVFGRDVGKPYQEVGGVMVTLAALCNASGLRIFESAELELKRVNDPAVIAKIRAKQATKPRNSPLPGDGMTTGCDA